MSQVDDMSAWLVLLDRYGVCLEAHQRFQLYLDLQREGYDKETALDTAIKSTQLPAVIFEVVK